MFWHLHHTVNSETPLTRQQEIFTAILHNRGLHTVESIHAFINPPSPLTISPETAGLNPEELNKAVKRILSAITNHQPIIIYGDYDADGITATAILWETVHACGAKAYPFIPSRDLHGYGLTIKGITDALSLYHSRTIHQYPLIITVDNGITAVEAASYLKDQKLDLIITDHHQLPVKLPQAAAIVHASTISGAGVAWFLAKSLLQAFSQEKSALNTLDLAVIGTVADLMPVTGVNRSLIKHGLPNLQNSPRFGLQAIMKEAELSTSQEITPYHIGFIIAPRLNAMGRLEHALDSLRLLLTTNPERAASLAQLLGQTNRIRQELTQQYVDHALHQVGNTPEKILIIDHESYHEGVIGLVAGKLAEHYYRPAIVIARKESISKASARSIAGVNITALIRECSSLLISVGGHPMAAGFSINTEKIEDFRTLLTQQATLAITEDVLKPTLKIDCLVNLSDLNQSLFKQLETLKPFGIGNPKPLFAINNVVVAESRVVGKRGSHLKLLVKDGSNHYLSAIGFNLGHLLPDPGHTISLAASLEENTFNGRTNLQLNLKDIHV